MFGNPRKVHPLPGLISESVAQCCTCIPTATACIASFTVACKESKDNQAGKGMERSWLLGCSECIYSILVLACILGPGCSFGSDKGFEKLWIPTWKINKWGSRELMGTARDKDRAKAWAMEGLLAA